VFDKAKVTQRIDELIDKGAQVLLIDEPPVNSHSHASQDYGAFIEWRTQALSFLTNLLKADHIYVTTFEKRVEKNYEKFINAGIGILKAVKEDIQGGYLESFESLISANLFSDFLEMAEHLLEEGYKDPAAVMIGGTLEEHLRLLCLTNSISITSQSNSSFTPKKASKMNTELYTNNVYSKIVMNTVIAGLSLRNEAAHGNYTAYSKSEVDLFLKQVRDFILMNPA
jgi:hypothetical protein